MTARKPRTTPSPNDATDTGAPVHFEAALERLETIVDELEGGELSLEESLARYAEGIRLSRKLTQSLDAAEKRIERLVEGGDGEPSTEPLPLEPKTGEPDGGEGELPF